MSLKLNVGPNVFFLEVCGEVSLTVNRKSVIKTLTRFSPGSGLVSAWSPPAVSLPVLLSVRLKTLLFEEASAFTGKTESDPQLCPNKRRKEECVWVKSECLLFLRQIIIKDISDALVRARLSLGAVISVLSPMLLLVTQEFWPEAVKDGVGYMWVLSKRGCSCVSCWRLFCRSVTNMRGNTHKALLFFSHCGMFLFNLWNESRRTSLNFKLSQPYGHLRRQKWSVTFKTSVPLLLLKCLRMYCMLSNI